MILFNQIFLINLLSATLSANSDFQACSSLLENLIQNTQASRVEIMERNSQLAQEPQEWSVGNGKIKFLYQNGKMNLEGTKEPISISETLTAEEIERFKLFTEKNLDRFDFKFNKTSNRQAIKEGIHYARLHEAFYGKDVNPLKAAREIESLINRSARFNNHLQTRVQTSQTTKEFLENVETLSENVEAISKLHREGKLQQAVSDYQQQRDQAAGAKILDTMVGKESLINLDEVVQNTEARKKVLNPEAVELELNFSHDEPIRVNIERTKEGKLKVEPRGKPGFSIKNLKQLVEFLQGKGYDGKSYDWRTYEFIESESF